MNAEAYRVYTQATQLFEVMEKGIQPKEVKKLRSSLDEMKSHIEGNID